MLLIRLSVVALVVLLLLPGPPRSGVAIHDFCGHYPKTCAASDEIREAVTYKLSFAMRWVKQHAGTASDGLKTLTGKADGTSLRAGDGSPAGDWRRDQSPAPYGSARYQDRYDGGNLTAQDRYPSWRGQGQQSRDYPGR